MSSDQITVLAILGVAMALFISRIRVDLVALLVVLALAVTGLCTPAQAVAGFGNTVVVMIASLLVVGEALARTGVADVVGGWITRLGKGREGRTRAAVIVTSAVLGSVMNSTAVVALFLPVVLRVSQEHRIPASRLLLPLAYGSLISGMMTLIGTAPNMIVHAELRSRDLVGLGFFDFTPIGLCVLLAAVACFGFGARFLLPAPPTTKGVSRRPRMRDLWAQFVPSEDMVRVKVVPGGTLVGQSVREAELGQRFGLRVLAVERPQFHALNRHAHQEPTSDLRFQLGDILTVAGPPERIEAATAELVVQPLPMTARDLARLDRDLGVAVVMIPPESELVGKSLSEASFRSRHNIHVAGLRRDGEALHEFAHEKLKPSDALLVMGPWSRIAMLQSDHRDFVLLTVPSEFATAAPQRERMPVALVILALMVVASAFGILPVVTSALAAAVLLVITGCIPMADAYRGIAWGSLVLIGGMLPLAEALGRTGVLQLAVESTTSALVGVGPRVVLAVIFIATAVTGSIVSNSATAVLMGPIAIGVAQAMGYSPQAFAMTVAIAASSAYLTPMASPVVSLVVEPGGYGFTDFLRAGLPLSIATLLITVLLVPILFPM